MTLTFFDLKMLSTTPKPWGKSWEFHGFYFRSYTTIYGTLPGSQHFAASLLNLLQLHGSGWKPLFFLQCFTATTAKHLIYKGQPFRVPPSFLHLKKGPPAIWQKKKHQNHQHQPLHQLRSKKPKTLPSSGSRSSGESLGIFLGEGSFGFRGR